METGFRIPDDVYNQTKVNKQNNDNIDMKYDNNNEHKEDLIFHDIELNKLSNYLKNRRKELRSIRRINDDKTGNKFVTNTNDDKIVHTKKKNLNLLH